MPSNQFSFELITQDNNARLGKITTPRGNIETPAFMPVGTQGTVKGIFPDDILQTNIKPNNVIPNTITQTNVKPNRIKSNDIIPDDFFVEDYFTEYYFTE